MAIYETTEPKAMERKVRRDWLFPLRVLGLLLVAPAVLFVGALATAAVREDEAHEEYHW